MNSLNKTKYEDKAIDEMLLDIFSPGRHHAVFDRIEKEEEGTKGAYEPAGLYIAESGTESKGREN